MHTVKSLPLPARSEALLTEMASRVIIADGAMGTMLQDAAPTLDDFQGLEGCNEILNVTRPDIITGVHNAYFDTGVDAVETNTFGANWSNLSDYDIDDRIEELAKAGAEIARASAESYEANDGRMRWVLGSMGPGTKLPSLGHTTYDHLKQTFATQALGLIKGGADAFMIETSQDLLQTKAAINGCKVAMAELGIRLPLFVEGLRNQCRSHGTRATRNRHDRLELRDWPARNERAPPPALAALDNPRHGDAKRRASRSHGYRSQLPAGARGLSHRARAVRQGIWPISGGRLLWNNPCPHECGRQAPWWQSPRHQSAPA
jgi:hypothetical protein